MLEYLRFEAVRLLFLVHLVLWTALLYPLFDVSFDTRVSRYGYIVQPERGFEMKTLLVVF